MVLGANTTITKECHPCHEANFIDEHGSQRTLRVPVVQELARDGVDELPQMFIRSMSLTNNSPIISCSKDEFPMVSLAKLISLTEVREIELCKLVKGLREWGMVLVCDHGMSMSLLGEVKDVVKGFFGLSLEEKKLSVGTYASVDNMGYGRNFIKPQNQPIDWIDRLTVKAAPQDSTNGLSVWPQNPANFRKVFESYVEEARKISNQILQALAEGLPLDENAFLQYYDPKTSEINIRVNYYPPCPKPHLTLGFNPHTDGSGLSFLAQFGTSGPLQVMHNDNWVTVPWPNDTFLVNVGDLLEIMSNGRVTSPWHRVVAQANVERYSLALFYNPPSCIEIEPAKCENLKDKYKKIVVGDYLKHVYEISPTISKQAIKFAMV